jgi:hypothetical protein
MTIRTGSRRTAGVHALLSMADQFSVKAEQAAGVHVQHLPLQSHGRSRYLHSGIDSRHAATDVLDYR